MRRSFSRTFYPSISTRITGPFLLAIVIVAAIGIFIVTYLVAGSIEERFKNQLVSSADAAANSIVEMERQQLTTLRLMAFTKGVAAAVTDHNSAQLDVWLRPIAANAGVDSLIVFDVKGASIFQLERFDRNPGIEYQFQMTLEVKSWMSVQNVIQGRSDTDGDKFADLIMNAGKPTIYLTAPIIDVTNQLVGGISIGISADRLARRIAEQSLSVIMLYDRDGNRIGNTLPNVQDAAFIDPTRLSHLTQTAINASPIENVFFENEPYQVLYAPFRVRSQDIGLLAIGLPSNYILERSSTSRDIFTILFFALFMGVGLIGFIISRSITRPVARLVETTRAIRDGDLTRRVGLRTPDELGELSTSFDHMTNQLVRRNHEVNKLYSNQLQETARRTAVLSSISDALIVQNPDGKIILSNPTAQRLLHQVRRDTKFRRDFTQLCAHPENLAVPNTVTFGEQFFSVLARSVEMPSGELLGYIIVFRDITPLIQAERLKDEMILQLSHELRTPLTSARGYVDLLKLRESEHLSPKGQEFIENTVSSLLTLDRMVNQVIDVSAMLAGHFDIDYEHFDLLKMVNRKIEFWRSQAHQHELRFSYRLSDENIWITGDADRIEQALDYLFSNAFNYTLPGGFIKLTIECQSSSVIIEITDSGVGIAPDEMDKVFERMYRGRSADAGPTDARGLGLGLYLTRQIIQAHQGEIDLESQLSVGTVVTVRLPIQQGEGHEADSTAVVT